MELLSKNRKCIMGFAIILVVIFHSNFLFPIKSLNVLKEFFYCVVDIFIFYSGFGCYCSLKKEQSIKKFISRRIKRIYPTYIVFISFWLIFVALKRGISLLSVLGNIFLFGYYFGLPNQFNWYVQALPLFYFIIILIYILLQKVNNKICLCVLSFLSLVLLSFCFFNSDLLIIFSRLPILLIGIICGYIYINNQSIRLKIGLFKKINKLIPFILISISIIFTLILIIVLKYFSELLWDYGVYWYSFIFITPGLLLLLCKIFNKFNKHFLYKILEFIGGSTFEIYLIHIFIFSDLFTNANGALINIILIIVSIVSGIGFNRLILLVNKYIKRRI